MVLGISFSHKKKEGSTDFLVKKALESASKQGADTDFIKMTDYTILPCTGCGACMSNKLCPLFKKEEDQAGIVYEKIYAADRFIFGFPVYAIGIPSSMKNLFERAPYIEKEDMEYELYNYDKVHTVKGKCFSGKVAALIAVATGMGHDIALGNLFPAFTAMKLTVSISVGLSLMEYDAMPHVKKHPWAKDIHEAEYAIQIMDAVGKRIMNSTSAFSIEKTVIPPGGKLTKKNVTSDPISPHLQTSVNSKIKKGLKLDEFSFTDMDDNMHTWESFNAKRTIFIIGRGQSSKTDCEKWHEALKKEFDHTNDVDIIRLISISKQDLPAFITPNFIKGRIKASYTFTDDKLLFDWDNTAINVLNIQASFSDAQILAINNSREVLGYFCGPYTKDKLKNFTGKIISEY